MIEIIIAIFILVVALGSVMQVSLLSLRQSVASRDSLQAEAFAKEALEAVRNFRDNVSWNNSDPGDEYDGLGIIAKGVAYHVEQSADIPPKWKLLQGDETLGIFTRSIVFEDGVRDANGDLTDAGGVADEQTVKVTATVSFDEHGNSRESELVMYLTNWQE